MAAQNMLCGSDSEEFWDAPRPCREDLFAPAEETRNSLCGYYVTQGSLDRTARSAGLQIALGCPAPGLFTTAPGLCDIAPGLDPWTVRSRRAGDCKGLAREQDQNHETPNEEVGTQETGEPDRIAQGGPLVRQGIAVGGH